MEQVTVIICSYSINRLGDVIESISSILGQTYHNVQIIIVVDRNHELFQKLIEFYKNNPRVQVLYNSTQPGLSGSRNLGIRHSIGDIIAFIDDDAIADKEWLSHLVKAYENVELIGCGGPIKPLWVDGMADWIPEELYWTMGCTYKGFKNVVRNVRSNFGSNMSFRRVAFHSELFSTDFGMLNEKGVGEEVEFSLRLLKSNKESRIQNVPDAVVYHKIFNYRKSLKHLFSRCFQYGQSIALFSNEIKNLPSLIDNDDHGMIRYLLLTSIPERIGDMFDGKSINRKTYINISQLFILIISLFIVIIGLSRTRIQGS